MNPISNFRKRFLKNTVGKRCLLKSIKIFQSEKAIYFISDGLMKREIKLKMERLYPKSSLEKVFVSVVQHRDFLKQNEKILLDTYVWITNEPEHTIHYTSNPVIKPRNNYN